MTDFFTHFSCVLDVGSARNAARAMTIYLDMLAEYQIDDAGGIPFAVSVEPAHGAGRLWIRDDRTGDPAQVVVFVLRCAHKFRLTGRWGFQWANTCTRPRVNAFGGGAHVIDLGSRETVAWIATYGWLEDTIAGKT